MKIKELKRIAKENDYIISRPSGDFTFKERVGENYINISGDYENKIWFTIPYFCNKKDFNMIKAAVEFAETPLEERGNDKKYHLKHKWIETEDCNYLNFIVKDNNYILYSQNHNSLYQTQFTKEEIEEIKRKLNTDLSDFEMVEVEDE